MTDLLQTSEILVSVRQELLGEAQRSPGLLSDLANLERYVAETYSARSFIELLQNADDAKAGRFLVTRHGDYLVCANDGLSFSRQDFHSLCRSASSEKQRGQTIGYRGIGFKSVVGVAKSVHLISGALRATFSRELTNAALGSSMSTPLVRIPHPLALAIDDSVLETVKRLEHTGYKTIFVLGGLAAERVRDEFDEFDADYLLFLRHIDDAVLEGTELRRFQCERRTIDAATREISISGPDRRSAWRIRHGGQCDLAFSLIDGKPVPLNPVAAIAHAFLPTLESTGFGVRINADFSTDPSRTRIVFDDATLACIEDAAEAIATQISQSIRASEQDASLLACLTPTLDLATLSLQKRSFRTELIARVKHRLDHLRDEVCIAPSWLNHFDTQNLASSLNRVILISDTNQNVAQTSFMRYLGVQAMSAQTVLVAMTKAPLSLGGCAELISHCSRNVATGVSLRQLVEMPIWKGRDHDVTVPLSFLIDGKTALSLDFVEAMESAGVSPTELAKVLRSAVQDSAAIAMILPDVVAMLPPSPPASKLPTSSTPEINLPLQAFILDPLLPSSLQQPAAARTGIPITSRSLPAWRGAEQYVALILEDHGYQVEDRSRQNLGYDLYVEKGSRKHYVEVKLLDYAGQPFIITTNEEVVARECGEAYILALTLRATDKVHVQFIHDPTKQLKFVRQCRQWVWECSEYEYQPQFQQD